MAPGRNPSALPAVAPFTQPTPTPPSPLFIPEVRREPLPGPVFPQDIEGRVLNRDGSGRDGVSVRLSFGGTQLFDTTKGGGNFKFTVTEPGTFGLRLGVLPSQEVTLTVDGRAKIQVIFREAATVTPTITPTPLPTLTPLPTVTPTVTPTPTPSPLEGLVSPETPSPVPPPTPGAAPRPSPLGAADNPLSLVRGFDLRGYGEAFLVGAGIGGVLFLLGLAAVLFRR